MKGANPRLVGYLFATIVPEHPGRAAAVVDYMDQVDCVDRGLLPTLRSMQSILSMLSTWATPVPSIGNAPLLGGAAHHAPQ